MTTPFGRHVFISYSHHDAAFVDRLSSDLSAAGVPLWIDRTGLTPGTPNWEQAIREAIRGASAILLVASPSSRMSLAVQGEVAVGRNQRVRVIPLWVDGDDWSECVSLEMVSFHYLDFRGAQYAASVGRLVDVLRQSKPPVVSPSEPPTKKPRPGGQILVDVGLGKARRGLPVHHMIDGTVFDTVNTLYMDHLWEAFPNYTYGIEWLLASTNRGVQRLVAPLAWLTLGGPRGRIDQRTALQLYGQWGGLAPDTFGVTDGTQWEVIDLRKRHVPAVGLATNNEYLAGLVDDLPQAGGPAAVQAAAKLVGFLQVFMAHVTDNGGRYEDRDGTVRVVPSQSLTPDRYQHMFVLTGVKAPFDGQIVIVETPSDRARPPWL